MEHHISLRHGLWIFGIEEREGGRERERERETAPKPGHMGQCRASDEDVPQGLLAEEKNAPKHAIRDETNIRNKQKKPQNNADNISISPSVLETSRAAITTGVPHRIGAGGDDVHQMSLCIRLAVCESSATAGCQTAPYIFVCW
jgi:hypothetical protein